MNETLIVGYGGALVTLLIMTAFSFFVHWRYGQPEE